MKFSEKNLLIFDYDGTIADTSKLHAKAYSHIFNPKIKNFLYEKIAGLKTIDGIKYYFEENNIKLKDSNLKKLVYKKQEIFRNLIEIELNPIPGVIDFLIWTKDKYNLTIASSGSKKSVLKGLKILGIEKFFDLIICSEDVKIAKPDPEIFNKVIAISKINKKNALIFEDSNNGILAAYNANIDCIDIRKNSFIDLLNLFKENDNKY